MGNWLLWHKITTECPTIANWFHQEWVRRKGFLPYEQGYIYVIHAVGSNYYKIGKSVNPDRRILQIAPQMPFSTRFIKVWRTDFMSMAESFLHRGFAEHRTNGEWFEFEAAQIECLFKIYMASMIRYNYAEFVMDRLSEVAADELRLLHKAGEAKPFSAADRGPGAIAAIQHVFDRVAEAVDPGPPPDIVSLLYNDCPEFIPESWTKGATNE